ncbi:MAG: class I SAM-dependent methyltransferase [Bryobacteraceae bacterium]|nr:class I SAM-dependent methyltransferase [Bryobacteraceae bacterium]
MRARYPDGEAPGIGVALPDLLPILHARDAAASKVAAIGSVNPRAGGPINSLIQFIKQNIARGLGWFVRDQIEFNRALLTVFGATLESLNEVNRTFAAVGVRLNELEHRNSDKVDRLLADAQEMKDIRSHWVHWREEWEKKLLSSEIHFLRSVSDLQALTDTRLVSMDMSYRDAIRSQHAEFTGEVAQAVEKVHQHFWNDLAKVRLDYEKLIHDELRVLRQKAFASAAGPAVQASRQKSAEPALDIDYARFADRFRGSEEYVRDRQRFYVPYFAGMSNVLDIGCGRGEFLGLMRNEGVPARGVDLDEESVALCRSKGLAADAADVFEFLSREPDASFDGIFAAQVIEHMTPDQVPRLVKMCSTKLKPGGILALETPNPECLAIFATHFYLDPTHTRPIPPGLLVFYYEEFGFGAIEVHRLSPAFESMPSLEGLPPAFRDAFFGGLDYGLIGRRL